MSVRTMQRIVGFIIIYAGLAMIVYGTLPIVVMVWAFVTGRALSDVHGRTCLLVAAGAVAVALGRQFAKGLKSNK